MGKNKKEDSKKVTFNKTELKTTSPEFSDEDIKKFQDECGKKPQFTIAEFNEVLKKPAEEFSYKDIRILMSKAGWLSDDERVRFKSILIAENLTDDEHERYGRIYPSPHMFYKYFPKKV